MKQSILSMLLLLSSQMLAQTGLTPYEQSNRTASATYDEAMVWYRALADDYEEVSIREYHRSDVGEPISLVTIASGEVLDRAQDERVFFLINNGIHPGEPCGVDACMMLARDLMETPELRPLLDHLVIGIIPIYNIGGSLNRGCCTRANQVGPVSQGFRGNAKNLDLNRDFMKMDSHNARAFAEIFQDFMPHIFLDTHTTNGADYQAPITYISTLADKLSPPVARYQEEQWVPAILDQASKEGLLLSPYVNKFDGPPEEGMAAFLDLPRYASGYAALFQTMSVISEAHMLKSFEARVEATYDLILIMSTLAGEHRQGIVAAVNEGRAVATDQPDLDVAWQLDTIRAGEIMFHGYESSYQPGAVTGTPRLYYDRSRPFERMIPYYRHYQATRSIHSPNAYIIPQAWTEVIERLQWNGVACHALSKDTTVQTEVYYLTVAPMTGQPYEGHFYHQDVTVRTDTQEITLRAGDLVVPCAQMRRPLIVHGLEPEARDSWFRWNFFDSILMQKEYFSPYLFENLAADILDQNPELAEEFAEKKEQEPAFAANPDWQLYYIYTHSQYYESSHQRYPVLRWHGGDLPVAE